MSRAVPNSRTLERFPRIRQIVTHCGGCGTSVANRLIDRGPLVNAFTEMLQRGETPSIEKIEAMMEDAQHDSFEQLGERRISLPPIRHRRGVDG